jgi:hypothetical protein
MPHIPQDVCRLLNNVFINDPCYSDAQRVVLVNCLDWDIMTLILLLHVQSLHFLYHLLQLRWAEPALQ